MTSRRSVATPWARRPPFGEHLRLPQALRPHIPRRARQFAVLERQRPEAERGHGHPAPHRDPVPGREAVSGPARAWELQGALRSDRWFGGAMG